MRTRDLTNILVVGAGPAGLYCATLMKRARPQLRVTVAEQNPAGATFGFGVVFSDTALDFLKKDDAETHDLVAPHMQAWRDMTLVHRGERVVIDGVGFSAIGRLELLAILEQRAAEAGVDVMHDRAIGSLDGLEADLIVGADGLNSLVRRSHEGDFRTSLSYFDNKFVWYGATRPFDTLTQTFVDSQWGPFNAHHYRYAPDRSTFIVECERATWLAAGFAELDEAAAKERCAAIFADTLDGADLISNRSLWRNFPVLWNERWWHRNRVLIGDALHTAHFSIGSGTRLAMEDAIALAAALARDTSLEAALEAYEAERKPIVRKLVDAANHSAAWYETFGARMTLHPLDIGYDYITRSGRVDRDRLRAIAPGFAARYDAHRLHTGKETSR